MARPAENETHRSELLLKIFFGAHTSVDEILTQLRLRLQKNLKTKAEYTIMELDILMQIPDANLHKRFWQLTLRNGMASVQAEIDWLKESIHTLEEDRRANISSEKK